MIAAALLDELARRGWDEARQRALSAVGGDESILLRAVEPAVLEEMFLASGIDRRCARAIGRRVVSAAEIGIALRIRSIATPERAFRNAQMILPREHPRDVYTAERIDGGHAVIRFDPAPERRRANEEPEADDLAARRLLGAVREGMLQGLPRSFGLAPAAVREVRGADLHEDSTRYVLQFESPRLSGLVTAAGAGGFVGMALALLLGGNLASAVALVSSAVVVAVSGRWSLALYERLEARGDQILSLPELLDQAETAVAERVDELAKLGASLERARDAHRVSAGGGGALSGVPGVGEFRDEQEEPGRRALGEVARAAAAHERDLAELRDFVRRRARSGDSRLEALVESAAADARTLRSTLASLTRAATGEGLGREVFDLSRLAQDSVSVLRGRMPDGVTISVALEHGGAPPMIEGDRMLIEELVEQLVECTLEGTEDRASIEIGVRTCGERVELDVSDDGPGIESERIERAFDPFHAEGLAADAAEPALARCLEIAAQSQGELRVAGNGDGAGHLTVSFPAATAGSDSEGVG